MLFVKEHQSPLQELLFPHGNISIAKFENSYARYLFADIFKEYKITHISYGTPFLKDGSSLEYTFLLIEDILYYLFGSNPINVTYMIRQLNKDELIPNPFSFMKDNRFYYFDLNSFDRYKLRDLVAERKIYIKEEQLISLKEGG